MKNNLSDMMGVDMYLAGLSKSEFKKIQKYLKPSNRTVPPLLCWDICFPYYQEMLNKAKINTELQVLYKYSRRYNWNIDLDKTLNAFPYEALVLTDETKNILWVNNGFAEMTGYPKSHAINRSPGFLQGEKTSEAVKSGIRKKNQLKKPFKEVIVNYRKNGSTYNCEVRIFPLAGDNSLHFLALEREVS